MPIHTPIYMHVHIPTGGERGQRVPGEDRGHAAAAGPVISIVCSMMFSISISIIIIRIRIIIIIIIIM